MKHSIEFKFKQLDAVLDYLYVHVWDYHQDQVEQLDVLLAELKEMVTDND